MYAKTWQSITQRKHSISITYYSSTCHYLCYFTTIGVYTMTAQTGSTNLSREPVERRLFRDGGAAILVRAWRDTLSPAKRLMPGNLFMLQMEKPLCSLPSFPNTPTLLRYKQISLIKLNSGYPRVITDCVLFPL